MEFTTKFAWRFLLSSKVLNICFEFVYITLHALFALMLIVFQVSTGADITGQALFLTTKAKQLNEQKQNHT